LLEGPNASSATKKHGVRRRSSLLPDAYARWRATEVGRITDEFELQLILELLGDVHGRRVLDVGCGDGVLAVTLAQRGAQVTGVDRSPVMIEAARRRAQDAGVCIDFCVARAEALPFGQNRFDLIVAVTILCFVAEPQDVFAEVRRVLRHGGCLVIGELGRWSWWAAERRLRAWMGSALWRQARFRTVRELQRLSVDSGLVPVSTRSAVHYPRFAWAARWVAPLEPWLGARTSLGAAFLVVVAQKPCSVSAGA
jgi:2-polyprenyl-3-methyl-5-hydroxy-6-metoxy-1,4-benzoquinol methylase